MLWDSCQDFHPTIIYWCLACNHFPTHVGHIAIAVNLRRNSSWSWSGPKLKLAKERREGHREFFFLKSILVQILVRRENGNEQAVEFFFPILFAILFSLLWLFLLNVFSVGFSGTFRFIGWFQLHFSNYQWTVESSHFRPDDSHRHLTPF